MLPLKVTVILGVIVMKECHHTILNYRIGTSVLNGVSCLSRDQLFSYTCERMLLTPSKPIKKIMHLFESILYF